MDKIFKLYLEDHSAASITSFEKSYFGSIETIDEFINTIQGNDKLINEYNELVSCLDKYTKGEKDITHNVAYKDVPFLTPVKILGTDTSLLTDYKWRHINTWGFPYDMKCEEVNSTHVWISCKGEYFRCIKSEFKELKYENVLGEYTALGAAWGLTYQIEVKNDITYNRMFVIEKTFKNKNEALADIEKFKDKKDPIFTEVLKDVFGDG